MTRRQDRFEGLRLHAIIAAWAVLVACAFGLLFEYSVTPGLPAEAPREWPRKSGLARSPSLPTLVMSVHPRCSCTRASLAELSRLVTDLRGKLRTIVLFARPEGTPEGWEHTDLWSHAATLEDVEVVHDLGGRISKVFGARTSGQVLLYDREGRRVFAGGITPTRSHQGDSVGRRRILELVREGRTDRDRSAVFGCPIREEDLLSSDEASLLERLEFGLATCQGGP